VLGSNEHMEDLLQESFIEVFKSLSSYRGEASLATWVDTIVTRVVYRHLSQRRAQLVSLAAIDDVRCCSGDLERQLDASHALRQLYAMLERVDPKYRIAYTLHVIDGRSLREIAQITGCSLMAVKNRNDQDPLNLSRFVYRQPLQLENDARACILLTEGLGDSFVPVYATRSGAWQLDLPQLMPAAEPVSFLPSVAAPVRCGASGGAHGAFIQFVPRGYPGVEPTPGCVGPEWGADGHRCAHRAENPTSSPLSRQHTLACELRGRGMPWGAGLCLTERGDEDVCTVIAVVVAPSGD